MEQSTGKIRFIQIGMMLMLMNGLMSHVILNPMLLDAAGRDAWLSVLATGLVYLPWCAMLAYIMKRSGRMKLQPWLAQKTTPFLSWLQVLPLALLLYLIGGMTIAHTTTWTISNYLPTTPKLALMIPLIAVCFVFAISGIRTIAIGSGFLLPIVVILGFFVAFANTPAKDYYQLRPFLENGVSPLLNGMVYAGGGFTELIILLGVQHHLKQKVKAWQLIVLGGILMYITLGPIVGAITEFGPAEAAKQSISPYEQWRLVELGAYIEHLDFFSIYQWLSGACIRISLSIYILLELFSIRSGKKKVWLVLMIMLSYVGIVLFPVSEYSFYLWMYRYYFPVTLIGVAVLSFLWAGIAVFSKPIKEAEPT